MKKTSKILSVLLALLMVCAVAATSVFAASNADVVAPAPDPLASAQMVKCDLNDYGISLTVPKLESFVSAESGGTEGIDTLGVNASALVETGFLLYDISADNSNCVYVQYSITPYTKATGSLNKLSAEELADELEAFNITTCENSRFGELDRAVNEKMGGSTVLHAVFKDTTTNANDTTTDVIQTIQNGVSYTIVSRLGGMDTEEGAKRHDEVINSIRFASPALGYGFEGNIAKNSFGINVFQLISSIILLILAGLLFFFFYRFSAFQKAADSSFNILGFDMPNSGRSDDGFAYSDEDGDGFDDDHDED